MGKADQWSASRPDRSAKQRSQWPGGMVRGLGIALLIAAVTACARTDGVPSDRSPATRTGRHSPESLGSSAEDRSGPSTRPSPGSDQALKEVGKGLYLKDGLPEPSMPFIDHIVVTGNWAEFEPQDQVFVGPGWSRLEEGITRPGIKVRLRIQAGRGAPSFVKRLGGPPISADGVDCSSEGGIAISKRPSTTDGLAKAAAEACVPYFWKKPVLDQYEQLMREVARRYEANPALLDVVDSACMTFFAEPFIRAGRSRSTNVRLFEAGLNGVTDEACQRRSVEIHDRAFPTTRVSLATHSVWQIVDDPNRHRNAVMLSWGLQEALLEDLRARYGEKLILQNNGLGGTEGCLPGGRGDPHFCWLAALDPPKGFQTEGDNRLRERGTSVLDAVERALAMGACFVEHDGFGDRPDLAESYDRRLKESC